MGEGKGKTSAAIGLAVRAAGRGKHILFAQFMKGGETGELVSFHRLENFRVIRCESKFPFYSQMTDAEKAQQRVEHDRMLCDIREMVEQRRIDVLVLDEITYPCQWELINVEQLREILKLARGHVEVVCTGRGPADWLLDMADYITDMQAVRHPYERGVAAREGIEY